MTRDPLVHDAVEAGAVRIEECLRRCTPSLAEPGLAWMRSLSATGRLADYFTHAARFPILGLPAWSIADRAADHPVLLADATYSTMAGYYHIRILDDVMDGHRGAGPGLLPLAAVFHTEFQSAYLPHFPADSPFWPEFRSRWLAQADATMPPVDGTADPAAALSARARATVGAVLIPLRALTLGAGVPERFAQWEPVVLDMALLDQLFDDVIDWQQDAERGQPNLLLAEGARRARPGEPVEAWVVREGYRWGLDHLRSEVDRVAVSAAALDSGAVTRFLASRRALADSLDAQTKAGLAQLASLAQLFEGREG